MDGAPMGVGSLWPIYIYLKTMNLARKKKEKLLFK
jgi:hypothetical protein